jgi:hypothetical protein
MVGFEWRVRASADDGLATLAGGCYQIWRIGRPWHGGPEAVATYNPDP